MYHVSPLHSVRQVKCISSLRSSMNCGNICRETANGNCKTLRNDEIIQYFCHEHRNNGNLIQNPLDKEAGIALFILKKN